MPNWTDEQLAAIEQRDGSLLVSAAAGSGKTAVLVDDEMDRKLNAEKLRPTVESLLCDGERRRAMANAAKTLGRPDAAGNVAQVLTGMITSGR